MRDLNIVSSPAGRREWIKARLRLAGYTFGTLARELGLSRTTAHCVLWRPYPKMEAIIAEKLGTTPATLWPDRYDRNGKPNRPMGRRPRERRAKRSTHACKLSTPDGGLCNAKREEAA